MRAMNGTSWITVRIVSKPPCRGSLSARVVRAYAAPIVATTPGAIVSKCG